MPELLRPPEGGPQRRKISHLSELLEMAEQAGGLLVPDLACHRMGILFELAGIS